LPRACMSRQLIVTAPAKLKKLFVERPEAVYAP